jgi:hypothetical protein
MKKNNSLDIAVAYSNDDNRRPLKNSAFLPPSLPLLTVLLSRLQKALKKVVIVQKLRNVR